MLASYTLIVVELKNPDCGFNHRRMMVAFYQEKDKDLLSLGKELFYEGYSFIFLSNSEKRTKMELSRNKTLTIAGVLC